MTTKVTGMTPGPWKVRVDGTHSGQGPIVYVEDERFDGGMRDIAELELTTIKRGARWKSTPERREAEANARAIAKLPELVEALRTLLLLLPNCQTSLGCMCGTPGIHEPIGKARTLLAQLDGKESA